MVLIKLFTLMSGVILKYNRHAEVVSDPDPCRIARPLTMLTQLCIP
jgi:hypothetical protein